MVVTIKSRIVTGDKCEDDQSVATSKETLYIYIYIASTMNTFKIDSFQSLDANPSGTLQRFQACTEIMELLFQLVFRKADGTPYKPSDAEKKAILRFKGGEDMKTLFQHVGKVFDTDTYEEAVKKISDGLSERTNKVVQRNMLVSNFPQGSKSFEKWSQEVSIPCKKAHDSFGTRLLMFTGTGECLQFLFFVFELVDLREA